MLQSRFEVHSSRTERELRTMSEVLAKKQTEFEAHMVKTVKEGIANQGELPNCEGGIGVDEAAAKVDRCVCEVTIAVSRFCRGFEACYCWHCSQHRCRL